MNTTLRVVDVYGTQLGPAFEVESFVMDQQIDDALPADAPIVTWIPPREFSFTMPLTRAGRRFFTRLIRRPVPAKAAHRHRYGR